MAEIIDLKNDFSNYCIFYSYHLFFIFHFVKFMLNCFRRIFDILLRVFLKQERRT